MDSVLVGMFDSQAEANAAHSKLIAAGFPASAISMTGGPATASASTGSTSHQEGSIARFFENLFGSEHATDNADRDTHKSTYTEAFQRGSYGLTVKTGSEAEMDRAEQVLNAAGAVDIDERSAEWRKEGAVGSATANSIGATLEAGGTQKLQEVQEELKVGKRAVSRGGVRVFTRMTEVPVEESLTLREERADVKRTVVDRAANPADLDTFKEGSFEVREMGEEAVVSKTARVTGEVEVGKTATEREETIRDTLRQTKVEVETLAAEPTKNTATTKP